MDRTKMRHFNVRVAEVVGVTGAVVLDQIDEWFKNENAFSSSDYAYDKVRGRIISDELWICATYVHLQKQFPFWSIRTIERAVKRLKALGLIKAKMENQLVRGSRNSNLHFQINKEHKLLQSLNLYL